MFERLLDKNVQPSIDEMTAYCGQCGAMYTALRSFMENQPDVQAEIRFPYGNKYGWSIAYRKKKKLVCDVFAEAGAFTVMIRLSGKQFASVYDKVLPYTQGYIDNKYPCGDGGWLHYRILEPEHLQDIETLLSVKLGRG